MKIWRWFLWIFLTIVLAIGAIVELNYFVYLEIQKRLDIHIEGQFIPEVYPGFRVTTGNFLWKDKVELFGGNIRVRYDPFTVFSRGGIRILVKSSGAQIRLLGKWANMQGVADAKVDFLDADIVLGRRRLTAINHIEVKSPTLQFSIKNVDK